MSKVNLYFKDLNPATQRKILALYGNNPFGDNAIVTMQVDDFDRAIVDSVHGDKNIPAYEDADKLFETDYETMKDILQTAEEDGCPQDLYLKLQTFMLDLSRRENKQKDLMNSFPRWLGALHAYLMEG